MTSLRRALAAAGIAFVAIVAIVAVIVARAAAILEAHRTDLLAAVGGVVGWPVEAESLDASWFPPSIIAQRPRVPDLSPYGPGALASADEARFEFALLPLLRGRLVVTEVRLQTPVLRVVRGADGGWNIARPAGLPPAEPHEGGTEWLAPQVVVDTVRVRNGRIVYRDRAVPGLGEVEMKAVNLRYRQGPRGIAVDWNAQALGATAENVSGRLDIPPPANGGERVAHLEIDGDGIDAARLPEAVAVLRGRVPFGLALGGQVSVQVRAEMSATLPPGSAMIDVAVEAEHATIRGAGGWIEKPAGAALRAEAKLRASGEDLIVDRLALHAGDAELQAEAEPGWSGGDAPPLAITSRGLDAELVGRWVPLFAVLEPHGALALRGKLTPGRGPLGAELKLTGASLGLVVAEDPIAIARLIVHLLLSDDGKRLLGSLRLEDVRAPEAAAGVIELAVGGPFGAPIAANFTLAKASIRGAPLERISAEGTLLDDVVDLRTVRAEVLGGELHGKGRWERRAASIAVSLDPSWSGIDLRALLLAVGEPARASGTLRGEAKLTTTFHDAESAWGNLAGDLDVVLADGEIADLNVAAATFDNLRAIPRLREAIERRARDRAPELLSETSRISLLSVRGTLAARQLALAALTLESAAYALEAKGRIGFDGATDMSGTLTLAPATAAVLADETSVVQVLAGPNGQVRIPVTVRGSYPSLSSAPTSDFLARIAARAITAPGEDDGGSWLQRLLRSRSGRNDGGEAPK